MTGNRHLRNLVIGWAILAAILGPIILAYLVAGPTATAVVGWVYIGLMVVGFLSLVAIQIGEMVSDERRRRAGR